MQVVDPGAQNSWPVHAHAGFGRQVPGAHGHALPHGVPGFATPPSSDPDDPDEPDEPDEPDDDASADGDLGTASSKSTPRSTLHPAAERVRTRNAGKEGRIDQDAGYHELPGRARWRTVRRIE